VPGHWEGDLVFGTRSSAIATLVERQSRFVLLVSPPHRHTASVVAQALAGAIVTLPAQLCRSLTGDQGKVGEHARFSVATGVPVYFCDPHSPPLIRPIKREPIAGGLAEPGILACRSAVRPDVRATDGS